MELNRAVTGTIVLHIVSMYLFISGTIEDKVYDIICKGGIEMVTDYSIKLYGLSPQAARKLSHSTKSVPMMEEIGPRWLLSLLPWVAVEAGVYRVNKAKHEIADSMENNTVCVDSQLHFGALGAHLLPQVFSDYEDNPKEYVLCSIQTILRTNSHVTDLFNTPNLQYQEQLRLVLEAMKERQEREIISNESFGLIPAVAPSMKVRTRRGRPMPDDMDELLAKVWKKPAFFLAHPRAIAAFGRECTRRGVPPASVQIYGCPFITWRGVPIIPCDKIPIMDERTQILLMRVGEKEQGVIGLHQPGIPDECHFPSLSVKFGGIDTYGISSYLLNLYFSMAVLADDALGMLEHVKVDDYYEY